MTRWLPIVVVVALAIGACASGESSATTWLVTAGEPADAPTTSAETTSQAAAMTETTSVPTTTSGTSPTVPADGFAPAALSRDAVPWQDVGDGWYVVLYDSSKADPTKPSEVRDGPVLLYLVDAGGARYEIAAWPPDDRPWTLADATATAALVIGNGATIDDTEWQVIDLNTGTGTPIHTVGFPDNSYASGAVVSLTRPTGSNAVVYRSDGTNEWLERRSLDGSILATIYTQRYTDPQAALQWMYGHDGASLLVAHQGGIAELSNTGAFISELWIPPDTRCDPVRWWNRDLFLAVCYGQTAASAPIDDYGQPHDHFGQLWLLETDGTTGTRLTAYPTDPVFVGDFGYHDAFPTSTETFIQWSGDCGAASINTLQPDGSGALQPITVPPTIVADGVLLVDVINDEMIVYGWQGCDAGIGALFASGLDGKFLRDLVPAMGDARGVIGVRSLTTRYP